MGKINLLEIAILKIFLLKGIGLKKPNWNFNSESQKNMQIILELEKEIAD